MKAFIALLFIRTNELILLQNRDAYAATSYNATKPSGSISLLRLSLRYEIQTPSLQHYCGLHKFSL